MGSVTGAPTTGTPEADDKDMTLSRQVAFSQAAQKAAQGTPEQQEAFRKFMQTMGQQ